jgi:histidyl-tRNA synthetase
MKKLSTDPYKGVRDFYPEDQALQEYIFELWRSVVKRYGYEEYNASILEPAELYRVKSGEEIVNEQTYTFTDRGNREVTLRPEMTPTVARLVAAKKRELPFPLRWFSIPNVFRYERPQRGRLREHWQLNVDMFGAVGVDTDVEILLIAYRTMKAFGAKDSDFEIKVGSRSVLDVWKTKNNIADDTFYAVQKLLDKKNKIDDFEGQLPALIGDTPWNLEIDEHSNSVIKKLAQYGVTNVHFDASIVRGFDYYTGMVFEVFDTHPENNRSLFGGGRYDNLLDIFDAEKTPAVGFGMGDVTIRDFLKTRGLLPTYKPATQLALYTKTEEQAEHATELAEFLREKGINVALTITDSPKLDKVFKAVEKLAIPYFILVGPEETSNATYTLRTIKNGGSRIELSKEEIAESILGRTQDA